MAPPSAKQVIELAQCPACRGMAVIEGVFHEMACVQCKRLRLGGGSDWRGVAG